MLPVCATKFFTNAANPMFFFSPSTHASELDFINMSLIKKIKWKIMEPSRANKVDQFYALCHEGNTVLDVGVSSETRIGIPTRNYFLKTFRYPAKYYTGLGVEDLSGMEELFPGKRFIQYPGGTFPFQDKEFDWVFSNAVIEHVGDNAAQVKFINEMLRVAYNVYFTTPYKYFPIESHTNVFFLHWNDSLFYQYLQHSKPHLKRYDIYLFSISRLDSIMRASDAASYTIHKNRLAGMTMTLSVMCSH